MRILIADDDQVSRLELESLLTRHGHEVVAVSDGLEAWSILQGENPPGLAVLDWMMEKMDGVEVCRRVRERPELSGVYLILLTSRKDKAHLLTGFQAGAHDYITKPFHREELLARIRVGGRMVESQAELAQRVDELEELATTDGLTGIANRRLFQSRLEAEFLRTKRHHTPLALMMIDVDHFKDFNDTYGHQAGDDVLKKLARLLAATSRNTDVVARYGGEEFAVILVNTELPTARKAAQRLHTQIKEAEWPHRDIRVSIGIACCEPDTETASELIRQADQALYVSKTNGRNQTTLYQPHAVC